MVRKFDPEAASTSILRTESASRIWGVEPSEKNLGRWNRLQPGDTVIFYDGKSFVSIAKVSRKTRNPALAKSLWGEIGKEGKTWELICYLADLKGIQLSRSEFDGAIGYKQDFEPLGFMIVDENRVQVLLAESKETDPWSALQHLPFPSRMGLSGLELKLRYRSGEDDLVRDFYIPCLEQCVSYDRAAGYYSAGVLNLVARGVAGLVRNNGTMRLVVDPLLSEKDIEMIKKGYEQRLDEALVEKIRETITHADETTIKRIEALAWLIGTGKLDIKVAITTGEENLPTPYPYHEKWGIFVDQNGAKVVFSGSMNETPQGLKDNFEAIDVYCSWKGDDSRNRISLKEQDFDRLWQNKTHGLRVLDFPEAAKKELLKYRPAKAPDRDPDYLEPRCPECLEPTDRAMIVRGVPVCLKCNSFLPVPLVGFTRYLIEGCRVKTQTDGSTFLGRVISVDYSKPSFQVVTDSGSQLDLREGIQRVAFEGGQRVLANKLPAVVISHVVDQKNGRLNYSVMLQGEERIIPEQGVEPPPPSIEEQLRTLTFSSPQAWSLYVLALIIESAPFMTNGEALLTASSKVKPYDHQLTVAGRIVSTVPPRFLLADEVGLGKTIEVGLTVKELQMRGIIERVLIIAPKLLVNQWIGELGRRFNIFCKEITSIDYAEAAKTGIDPFHDVDFAVVSYQLVQRENRRRALLESEPWDIIIVDEAHHIRRDPTKHEKNELFKLVDGWDGGEGLKDRSEGLLLVSATPLQLRIEELYDLMNIVGLGGKWATASHFSRFFLDTIVKTSADLSFRIDMARDFLKWGDYDRQLLQREIAQSGRSAGRIDEILHPSGREPSRQELDDNPFQRHLERILTLCTPLRWLMFRNTREILRKYGLFVPKRIPKDHLFPLGKPDEEEIYNELGEYIRGFYEKAQRENRKALGFVMATYRKRLTSSLRAIQTSLDRRLEYLNNVRNGQEASVLDELKLPEEQDEEDYAEEDRAQAYHEDRKFGAEVDEEIGQVKRLLARLESLTTDTKLERLQRLLAEIFRRGADKVIIFTQYYDTLDYLRESLSTTYQGRIVCYSGKGGEISDGSQWKSVGTDDAVKEFQRSGSIMISTEAGSEGKNFQFCNIIINYDLPWNPMRVEQRIGRVDRIGQRRDVEIHNMFFENTIDGEVYVRLRTRIHLFETVVGPLHPILEKIENYALEYPPKQALVKINAELDWIESNYKQAQEIEERAQDFLFSGFDKSAIARFGVSPPIRTDDIRTFVEVASQVSKGEMTLTHSDPEGLYKLTLSDPALKTMRLMGAYGLEREMPVVFSPQIAEDLSAEDSRFQDVRLVAHGSPMLQYLLERWRVGPESKFTIITSMGITRPNLVLLYKAKLEGLLHREEIVSVSTDLETLQTSEAASLEPLLQEIGRTALGTSSQPKASDIALAIKNPETEIGAALRVSRDLWGRLFARLNEEWTKKDQDEHDRRKGLLDSSLNRIHSKALSTIEGHVRRLIALRYIQEYPNVDRLPDGLIDVSQIAGQIRHWQEVADIFSSIGLDPSGLQVRGRDVTEEARSFRNAKQRQALHLQVISATQAIRSEYDRYRKIAEKINARVALLEKQRGKQATYMLAAGAILVPANKRSNN